jgi:hypothetical protein
MGDARVGPGSLPGGESGSRAGWSTAWSGVAQRDRSVPHRDRQAGAWRRGADHCTFVPNEESHQASRDVAGLPQSFEAALGRAPVETAPPRPKHNRSAPRPRLPLLPFGRLLRVAAPASAEASTTGWLPTAAVSVVVAGACKMTPWEQTAVVALSAASPTRAVVTAASNSSLPDVVHLERGVRGGQRSRFDPKRYSRTRDLLVCMASGEVAVTLRAWLPQRCETMHRSATVNGSAHRVARVNREPSVRRCSISSGGSCTSKSTSRCTMRSANHLRSSSSSSSPVRYWQVCASIGLIAPQ